MISVTKDRTYIQTGTMIRVLNERAGVCYINDNAISFAQRIKELNRSN